MLLTHLFKPNCLLLTFRKPSNLTLLHQFKNSTKEYSQFLLKVSISNSALNIRQSLSPHKVIDPDKLHCRFCEPLRCSSPNPSLNCSSYCCKLSRLVNTYARRYLTVPPRGYINRWSRWVWPISEHQISHHSRTGVPYTNKSPRKPCQGPAQSSTDEYTAHDNKTTIGVSITM